MFSTIEEATFNDNDQIRNNMCSQLNTSEIQRYSIENTYYYQFDGCAVLELPPQPKPRQDNTAPAVYVYSNPRYQGQVFN